MNYSYQYILSYLNKYKRTYQTDININVIAKNIYEKYISTGLKEEDLLLSKHDDFIKSFIINRRYSMTYSKELVEMIRCVDEFVKTNKKGFSDKDISKDIIDLSMTFISKNKTVSDINNGELNEVIRHYFLYKNIKLKSVMTNNNSTTKIKQKRIHLSNKTKALILAGAIIGMTSAYSFSKAYSYNETVGVINSIDEYEYPTISYEMANEFIDTTDNILSTFNNYTSYGKEYGQLSLFKAYESFAKDKYHGMDSMISLIREQTKDDNDNLYNEINEFSCYPKYVYDKLISAGVLTEDNEYKNAVNSYNRQYANYKGTHPYANISQKEQKSLDKMMIIYSRYCSNLSNKMFRDVEENVKKV